MGHDSVSTVVLSDDGASVVLMLREDVCRWTLPGGRIEPGETRERAASARRAKRRATRLPWMASSAPIPD